MENIDGVIFIVVIFYTITCPYTKVEESFNLQATHDLLYLNKNITQYDHHEFPGVVPRTFIGPLVLATLSSPLFLFWKGHTDKILTLYLVRVVLGFLNSFAISKFRKFLSNKFGYDVSIIFIVLTCSQFHLLFYISRTLPNSFAFGLVLLGLSYKFQNKNVLGITFLVIATVLFRCDVAILLFSVLLHDLILEILKWNRKTFTQWFQRTLYIGIAASFSSLFLTVGIDSFFWRRVLWPEGEVFYFNTILNKSSEWGVMPFHWYFTSALPRSMLTALLFIPLGLIDGWSVYHLQRKVFNMAIPIFTFVCLYSFLPHKELRFIFYAIPILNGIASIGISKIYRKIEKVEDSRINKTTIFSNKFRRYILVIMLFGMLTLNIFLTGVFYIASYRNYPGGNSMRWLHLNEKPGFVHIDVHSAMTGVSRFLEQNGNGWKYSKDETLGKLQSNYYDFDYLITGEPNIHIKNGDMNNKNKWSVIQTSDIFSGIDFKFTNGTLFKSRPNIYVLKKVI
jgi:alpha-1,6-mannosyltransferase